MWCERMFKIVQTTERGKPQLCIVPAAWERNGTLYWPRKKAEKLVIDGSSIPGDDWFEMTCVVKRTKLKTLAAAETELEEMLECDDTDASPALQQPPKKAKVILPRKKPVRPASQANFNPLANYYLNSPGKFGNTASSSQLPVVNTLSSDKADMAVTYDVVEQSSLSHNSEEDNMEPQETENCNMENQLAIHQLPFININDVSFPVESDTNNHNSLLRNQEKIIKDIGVLLNQVAGFNVLMEELMKRFEKLEIAYLECNEDRTSRRGREHSSLKDFKPVDSLEDIDLLEAKLKDEDFMKSLIDKLSFICGKSGKEHGYNVCYTLVDNLFTRKFMTLCSWAGGSRGDGGKIPFKAYRNIKQFFFKLVHLADCQFTFENCESFFKNVLKNSTRRNMAKVTGSRSSKSKRRPKKLVYKIKKSQTNAIQTNENETLRSEENYSGSELSDNGNLTDIEKTDVYVE